MTPCKVHGEVVSNRLGECPRCWHIQAGHTTYLDCNTLCKTAKLPDVPEPEGFEALPATRGENYEDTDLTSFDVKIEIPDVDGALAAMAASDQITQALANRHEAVWLAGSGLSTDTLRYLVFMRTSILELALRTEFRFA